MKQETATSPNWNRYRSLLDETSRLEYEIIGIYTAALCRKDGNGEPNADELIIIDELKSLLLQQLLELKDLQQEVAPILQSERQHALFRDSDKLS
jgi:hypothetical protein